MIMKYLTYFIIFFSAIVNAEQPWTRLCDGKSLSEWKIQNDGDWRVEEGANVVDQGKIGLPPVTATLKVAFKDHFPVGAAINRSHATGSSVGRRTLQQVEQEIGLIKAQFNQITAENDMKWERIHPRPGADGYDFAPADAFVEFGDKHGLQLVGHTLVWHNQTPDWVFAGAIPPPLPPGSAVGNEPGYFKPIYAGPRASREELLARMREHIHTVVGRYKGKVKVWDVVNEALPHKESDELLRNSLWHQIIGPDYIAKAFQYAHEADPAAILRYNDFGLEQPWKIEKLGHLIRSLQAQGVPIHAIGTQAHLNLNSSGFASVDRSLAALAQFGLPVHVTELDINNKGGENRTTAAAESELTRAYENVFRAIMKHRDSVKMVTFWGVNDPSSWIRGGNPLLFDGNCQPKPAFEAVIRLGHEPGNN